MVSFTPRDAAAVADVAAAAPRALVAPTAAAEAPPETAEDVDAVVLPITAGEGSALVLPITAGEGSALVLAEVSADEVTALVEVAVAVLSEADDVTWPSGPSVDVEAPPL